MSKCISIFAGSKLGNNPAFASDAIELAAELARAKLEIVCGGGQSGLMGTIIEAAARHCVPVTGVVIANQNHNEVISPHLTSIIEVETLTLRKETILMGTDAIIALPGGIGVFDEIFHSWALGRINKLNKKLIIVNTAGYFDSLKQLSESIATNGFVSSKGFAPVFCSAREAVALCL